MLRRLTCFSIQGSRSPTKLQGMLRLENGDRSIGRKDQQTVRDILIDLVKRQAEGVGAQVK